ncbi:MAG TPA: hypothetical protein VHJ79_17395, partial [Mycobacterium sp.]|nr:hypothetical protein [Mycobacterium sp.]
MSSILGVRLIRRGTRDHGSLRVRRDCERAGGTSGPMDQPTAEQALRQLEPLVGEWTVEAKWP